MRDVTERLIQVVYTKYGGRLHWHHTMRYLGSDEHGIWLGSRGGSSIQRGSEPPVVLEQPFVGLITPDVWWTATFNGPPARTEIYCDIGTPARWPHRGKVTMIDLDLDVLRDRASEDVLIVDEDDFAEHQRRYGYPPEVIDAAEQAAAWLHAEISARREPFVSVYLDWLARVSS